MRPVFASIIAVLLGWFGGRAWQGISESPDRSGAHSASNTGASVKAQSAGGIEQTKSATTAAGPADAVAALASVLESVGRDALRANSDLYAVLQNFTAEDFLRLTRDPAAFDKLAKSMDKSWSVKRAFIEGFLERWVEVDERSAFAWFESRPELIKAGSNLDYYAVSTLSRLRPDGMLALVLKMPEGDERKGVARSLIQTIGATDLEKAKEWAGRFEDKGTRDAAEKGWRFAWAKIDPFGAVAAASSLSGNDGDEVWRAAMNEAARRGAGAATALAEKATTGSQISIATEALSRSDPAAAAQLFATNAAKFPGQMYSGFAESIGVEYAARDLEQARAWADGLPEKLRIEALGAVTRVWAATDPRGAMAWLAEHPAREAADAGKPVEQRQDASAQVFSAWLGRDEAAARSFAASLPAGEARDAADASLINYLTQSGRTAEAAAMLTQSENLRSGTLAARVAEVMARDDPMAAASWAASLPPGPNQTQAVKAAAGAWAGRDPVSVAQWIEEFPAGEVRDRAVGAYAESIVRMDTAASAEWVMQVADPWHRARAARTVFWEMRQRDPRGAGQWFASLPGIDEAIRRTTLQDAR